MEQKNYHVRTIVDLSSKSIQVNVPTIDPNWELYFGEGLSLSQMKDKMRLRFARICKRIKKEIREEWDLFMGYTRLLDIFGHVAWNTDELMNAYRQADEFVGELKTLISGEKYLFLIVSDHGMQRLEGTKHGGKHTLYACYSSNIPLSIEKLKITDIFGIVEAFLQR